MASLLVSSRGAGGDDTVAACLHILNNKDDSLICIKATDPECRHLKLLFETYAKASGQFFNYTKSSVFFSPNISKEKPPQCNKSFQLQKVTIHDKYLRLPSMVGRNKKKFFNDIKLRAASKISNWQERLISSGGKEILIKVVA